MRLEEEWRDKQGVRPAGILLADLCAIYIPIPKVANTSVKAALADALGLRGDVHWEIQWPWVEPETIWSHYADWFVFTFVRNPWDRLLSCYLSKIHPDRMDDPLLRNGVEPEFWKYGSVFHGKMSFTDFVRATAAIPDEEADIHFGSQYLYVTDPSGGVFVDFLGRFESLDSNFEHVCERIGLPGRLPHLLQTQHGHYSSYYTPETEGLVRERWVRDIDLFAYSF
ncbi:MAG: sulfotransferase family 2 domain-containing protein [Gemmatimonadetes bacterium]|jgi:chondroitin 4-sulfotransferase 11|nr:sulfotransferase family 2 domain-containing protein [Gemmatimonadota bacterium]